MRTYEFYAKPENGVIPIPQRYRNRVRTSVKVILLEETAFVPAETKAGSRRKSDLLLPPTVSTKGWRFNREAANER